MKDSCPERSLSWYAYLQLKSLLSSMDDEESRVWNKTPFWKFSAFIYHSLSSIYAFLQTPSSPSLLPFVSARENELGTIFFSKNGKKLLFLRTSYPWHVFLRRKIVKFSRDDIAILDQCWRCTAFPGMMLHIWGIALPYSLSGITILISPPVGLFFFCLRGWSRP